jgi:hypothetical protein
VRKASSWTRDVSSGYCQDKRHAQGDKQAQDRQAYIKPQIPEKMEMAASGAGVSKVNGFQEPKAKKKREIENKPVDGSAKEEDAENNGKTDEHKLSGIGKFPQSPQPVKKYRKKAHQGKKDGAPPDQHKNQRITGFESWL